MVDRCMRKDSSCCDPSRITINLQSLVIRLGSQLEESFLMHLSTIWFSLMIHPRKLRHIQVNQFKTSLPNFKMSDFYTYYAFIYGIICKNVKMLNHIQMFENFGCQTEANLRSTLTSPK